jgi:CheY-like chemotaxis protein
MNKNILIVDDDVNTSLKYKKWLEEEGFNLTLINDPNLAEDNFKPQNYDLVLIGFRMSVVDGFDLYYKLHEISKRVEDTPKRIPDMLYDFLKNKLQCISRDSSRIGARVLCIKRSCQRCVYKTCLFSNLLIFILVILI